jgi:hypothetical protein
MVSGITPVSSIRRKISLREKPASTKIAPSGECITKALPLLPLPSAVIPILIITVNPDYNCAGSVKPAAFYDCSRRGVFLVKMEYNL